MKVLIVAKTRRGPGACVGGITADGRSVRLIAADAATNEHAGLEYEVGEVWEIDPGHDANIVPPHVENIIVLQALRLRRSQKLEQTIHRFMPPAKAGPENLFEGLPQATPSGGLYIAERTGVPKHSTMFWIPDRPLRLDYEGKRIRYRYPTADGGRTLTFVGFQEPLTEIPAGTLLRVSLAHWWRPKERPGEELRCFLQLSGWFRPPEARHRKTASLDQVGGQSFGGGFGSDKAATDCSDTAPNPARSNDSASRLLPRALEVMKETFGFSQFLPVQGDVIASILQRRDTLVVMPTGGGKSLCYQLPSLLFDGLTVVVSPLVALMQDQIRQLHQVGVAAACLNHMVPLKTYKHTMDQVRHGELKILYLAPETLLRPETLLMLEQSNLACFAVDEAHCISEWGHDFRPEYRQLQSLRHRFPKAVCVVLTATATIRVRADIRRLLGIKSEHEFVASFNRPNLFLSVQPRRDGLAQILAFLQKRRGESGIIYCGKRKQADTLCADLNANGWPALPYHAGLDDELRRTNQDRFSRDDVPIIVATIAFGMGINKSNVRFVIHAHLPKDVESYYQEIGRAGRDGLPAHCLLLYSVGDAVLHRHFNSRGAESERLGREARLQALLRFADTRDCRRKPLLAYFDEALDQPCGQCDNCVHAPADGELRDATTDALKLLSCVQQTGQVFGQAHIIAVLRGSQAARVLDRRHDQLGTYGAGKELSARQWGDLARQFIRQGLLDQDLEFASLRLTPKGWAVLGNKEQVFVPAESAPTSMPVAGPAPTHDPGLFEGLRKLRRDFADRAHVPAYVIFSDRSLVEMSTFFPQDKGQFLRINGVGQAKCSNYGDAFIEAIRAYCLPRGLAARPVLEVKPVEESRPSIPAVRSATRRRFEETGELFRAGRTINEIAQTYGVLPETVIQNLYRFKESGGELDPRRVLSHSQLSEAERQKVFAVFGRLGHERLASVHEALSGTVSYAELHVLRLYLLCSASQATHSKT